MPLLTVSENLLSGSGRCMTAHPSDKTLFLGTAFDECSPFVEWSYGYNLSFGDNVVVHRYVLLDDRGGIEIGNNVSISDYANIYSHTHDINDINKVYNLTTRIGDGARVTYHATVLAGTQVGAHSMVGTAAVATKDVEPYHIKVGIPAKTVKVKRGAAI